MIYHKTKIVLFYPRKSVQILTMSESSEDDSRFSRSSDSSQLKRQSMKTMFLRHRLKGGKVLHFTHSSISLSSSLTKFVLQANIAALTSNAIRMVARTGRRDSESSNSSIFNSTFSTDGSDTMSEASFGRRRRRRIRVSRLDVKCTEAPYI